LAKLILTAADAGLSAGLVGLDVCSNTWARNPTNGQYAVWLMTRDGEDRPRQVARLELHFADEESES
jgi:hypothetical protein